MSMKQFSMGRVRLGRSVIGCFFALAVIVVAADSIVAADELEQAAQSIVTLSPATDSVDVCPDTPLRITFASPPTLGSGMIEVVDVATDAVVARIDVAEKVRVQSIGGLPNFHVVPVLVMGNDALLSLPGQTLGYGTTYEVRVPPGAFLDADGNPSSGTGGGSAWQFATKAAPPASGSKRIVVATDGSGDFATVQGAIDSVPDGNDSPVTIFIRRGIYNEIICFNEKHNLTIVGESRKETVIAYRNNEIFNHDTENPFAPGSDPSKARVRGRGGIYRRGLFLAHRSRGLTLTNLTLRNTTEQGGSQSEAIILNGGPRAHAILTKLDLFSFQDTLQINGQAFVSDCYVEGDVDFLWGTGPCFFERCQAKSLRSRAYYTQIRNPPSNHGYIFNKCRFNGAPGINGNVLSRIDPQRFPASEVVLLDCVLTPAVGAIGWQLDNSKVAPDVHFWEFNSHQDDGQPVDMSKRLPIAKQLELPEDQAIIDNYRDPHWVLGGEWTPSLKPIVLDQPSPVLARKGETVVLTVNVAAVPRAAYQWRHNGRVMEGADSPTLTIESVQMADAGEYDVVIANMAGEINSQSVALSVAEK